MLLSLAFAGTTGIALIVVTAINLFGARINLEEMNRDRIVLAVDAIDNRLREHLDPIAMQLEDIARWIENDPGRIERHVEFAAYARGAMAATLQVPAIALTLPDYRTLYVRRSDARFTVEDWSRRADIRALIAQADRDNAADWTEPLFSPVLSRTIVVHRRPIKIGGELRGVLLSSVTIDELSRYVAQLTQDLGVQVFILHGRDRVLAHPRLPDSGFEPTAPSPLPMLNDRFGRELAAMWQLAPRPLTAMAPTNRLDGHYVSLDGAYRVYAYREIRRYGATPWLVGMHFGPEFANAVNRFWWIVGISGGVLLLAISIAAWIGSRLSRPIGRIAAAANSVRLLDFAGAPILPRSRIREIDAAAGAFNAMTEGLRWLETYVPRTLTRRLLSRSIDDRSMTRELPLTIMFTDIVGFSSLAESMPAAETAALLNAHFAAVGACVEATDGTIDKYIGDGVMAFWGAPDAQPDHALRAYRTTKTIAQHVRADNVGRAAEGRPAIRVRIGLHTGRAIVGNIGFEGRMNYTTVGDTVNIAQRIEQAGKDVSDADDVVVLASQDTLNAIGIDVGAAPLGARPLRGRATEVAIFRIL